jgi:hypothetical protein
MSDSPHHGANDWLILDAFSGLDIRTDSEVIAVAPPTDCGRYIFSQSHLSLFFLQCFFDRLAIHYQLFNVDVSCPDSVRFVVFA